MSVLRHRFQSLSAKVIAFIGVCCFFATCYIVSSLYSLPLNNLSDHKIHRHAYTADEYVKVLIVTKESHLAGAVALVNSIVQNTQSPVHFCFVTDATSAQHLNLWLESTKLHSVSYEIKVFNVNNFLLNNQSKSSIDENVLQYSLLYIPELFPHIHGRLVCLSDDVIVQGDVAKLENISISSNHFGALTNDCDIVNKRLKPNKNKYYHFLNMKNSYLKKLQIEGENCAFDLSVMVLNMTLWKMKNVTEQFKFLLELNEKENIFHINSVLSPFLIVFQNGITHLDHSWHVRHLGVTSGTRYSRKYVQKANLLQWNGNFKPWKHHKSPYADLWFKYYVPNVKYTAKERSA